MKNFLSDRKGSQMAKKTGFLIDEQLPKFIWSLRNLKSTTENKNSKNLGLYCLTIYGHKWGILIRSFTSKTPKNLFNENADFGIGRSTRSLLTCPDYGIGKDSIFILRCRSMPKSERYKNIMWSDHSWETSSRKAIHSVFNLIPWALFVDKTFRTKSIGNQHV